MTKQIRVNEKTLSFLFSVKKDLEYDYKKFFSMDNVLNFLISEYEQNKKLHNDKLTNVYRGMYQLETKK